MRVALITTAGLHLQDQTPYDDRIIGGDCSYREIPNTIETQVLALGHRSKAFDASGTESDINLVLPLDRFRELETEGKIVHSTIGISVSWGRLQNRNHSLKKPHLKSHRCSKPIMLTLHS